MKLRQFSIKAIATVAGVVARAVRAVSWFFDRPLSQVEAVVSLHHQTDIQIFRQLGAPERETRFTMDKTLGEFRIELYNTYSPGSPGNANVEIRECTWGYRRHKVTVWFHKPGAKWVALDSCRYGNGIRF